ncbi:hypothetical protein ND861_15355 [Leptospira sp. 2 VSF19]|uniref:LigB n=1 Tax=Leptospira soteropolitanensis TaxID=2950025 RepID=A0AAW5VJK0_9LEPT|nr:hypothetical protein [Leptospira soteropolitanensis]MCW7494023.1 hypothetical protein [Leptospira soteropolitanensis]MCW7501711.1 hypothetical protein [Leptospira soteropolitanensis]MCW7523869.1 hypothetical protein [Leptospira soteropolitanensis]MCW7527734.1 hypothetical protein [Leptospira soteropolitanensis]MCW7531681.1 hypothetical protein [Leptospira soteropolitanensis]
MIKIFGISLLTISLSSAFLSEENVLVRTRGAKSSRVSGKGQLSSSLTAAVQKSSSEETSGTKDLEDVLTWNGKGQTTLSTLHLTHNHNLHSSFVSGLLASHYLSLPPPV